MLGDDIVERSYPARILIESTSNCTTSPSALVQEIDKSLLGTRALVSDRVLEVLALREEFDRRVTLDTLLAGDGLGVFSLSVDFGDDDVLFAGEVFGEGFPGRG